MEATFEWGIVVGLLVAAAGGVIYVFVGFGGPRFFGLGQRLARLASKDPAAEKTLAAIAEGKPKEEKPAKPSGEPLRLLALLQREGRLLDFLLEDVKNYPDAQIGV